MKEYIDYTVDIRMIVKVSATSKESAVDIAVQRISESMSSSIIFTIDYSSICATQAQSNRSELSSNVINVN
jgi:hypothetical protein